MMTTGDIIDVTEADFEFQVLAYSRNVPVIVDFWAPWCAPCRVLSPLLEKLARESQGSFRLAKVNVDEAPNLSRRFNIRSIPVVKAFRDGAMVSEFVGALPEPRLREFIRALAPSQGDLNLEKGLSLLNQQDPLGAEQALRLTLAETPDHPQAQLGLLKSLLWQGKAREAAFLQNNFPASREFNNAETLRPLTEALLRGETTAVTVQDDELDAAFENALRLVKRGNLEAALDGWLDILRKNKTHRNGETRKVILAVLELMGEANPLTRQYRNELAAILF